MDKLVEGRWDERHYRIVKYAARWHRQSDIKECPEYEERGEFLVQKPFTGWNSRSEYGQIGAATSEIVRTHEELVVREIVGQRERYTG